MREIFKKIQKEENGYLDITRKKVSNGRVSGARDDQEYYYLSFIYNGVKIKFDCELGIQSVAHITCALSKKSKFNTFEISTRSYLQLLFTANKNRFLLETENNDLSKFITNNTAFKELHSISKRTKFQPMIIGESKKKSYTLISEYHLFFNERNETFIPLIQFYKDLIDYFKRH